MTNAGDISSFDAHANDDGDDGTWAPRKNGIEMDSWFLKEMAAQLDGTKELAA